jgi:DNA-binding NarL/FixJ family response regulator
MPTYEYAEIPLPNDQLDEFPAEFGLWGDYTPLDVVFEEINIVAEALLTKRQYVIFLLLAKGYNQADVARITRTSQQAVSCQYRLIIKKMKKYYQ